METFWIVVKIGDTILSAFLIYLLLKNAND